MKISQKDWQNYIDRLRKINTAAADKVIAYMQTHDYGTSEGMKLLVDYAHAVAVKYGEGSAELACQMYDAVAEASNAHVRPAVPAQPATYGETARAVYGTVATHGSPEAVGAAIGRNVKLAGVDTTMQNALRDGAEWAWIPNGDTCAFCLMLASRGWVKASQKAIKNGHAEHVHSNCDCTYQIRFDSTMTVEGYDPDALYDWYKNSGDTSRERLNSMRRQLYAEDPEKYRAQARALYRKTHNAGPFKDLQEPMMLKHVREIAKEMGADMHGTKFKISRDEALVGSGFCGSSSEDRKFVTLFPDAFENRETLVKTIGHEHTHLRQLQEHGKIQSLEQLDQFEKEARASEEEWWNAYVRKTGFRQK